MGGEERLKLILLNQLLVTLFLMHLMILSTHKCLILYKSNER